MTSLFISHVSQEAPLARALKRWLEKTFVDDCRVFVSSDPGDLLPGEKWLDRIDEALRNADALLVLCSPASLPRPWISFETGCAWIRQVPVIPICHSGISLKNLPRPLSDFHALEMDGEDFGQRLLQAIASLSRAPKNPSVDLDVLRRDLNIALGERSVVPRHETSPPAGDRTSRDLDETARGLLCDIVDASAIRGGIYISDLHSKSKLQAARLIYYLEVLSDLGLITGTFINDEGVSQRLEWRYQGTKQGLRQLFEEAP